MKKPYEEEPANSENGSTAGENMMMLILGIVAMIIIAYLGLV